MSPFPFSLIIAFSCLLCVSLSSSREEHLSSASGPFLEFHPYVETSWVFNVLTCNLGLQVRKDDLATKEELAPFYKHVTSLAAIDFLVCLKSDVFVMTHGGNFAKLIIGARRYWGHQSKSIKPHKGLMAKILGDPDLGWPAFVEEVALMHEGRTGLPEPTFPVYDIYENPLTNCMCRVGN